MAVSSKTIHDRVWRILNRPGSLLGDRRLGRKLWAVLLDEPTLDPDWNPTNWEPADSALIRAVVQPAIPLGEVQLGSRVLIEATVTDSAVGSIFYLAVPDGQDGNVDVVFQAELSLARVPVRVVE